MAVFVENTMDAAKATELKRRRSRERYQIQVAEQLQTLVIRFCKFGNMTPRSLGMHLEPQKQRSSLLRPWSLLRRSRSRSETLDEVKLEESFDYSTVQITKEMFEKIVADPMTVSLLDELEVMT